MVDLMDTEDLFCLTCGYNLRGLPGEPRRCPECGNESSVEAMRLSSECINRKVRKLETWPAMSVGCILLGILLFFFLMAYWDRYYPEINLTESDVLFYLFGFSAGVSLIGWLFCVLRFRNEAEKGSPWLVVLVEMHLAVFLLVLGFVTGTVLLITACNHGIGYVTDLLFFLIPLVLLGAGYFVYRESRNVLAQVRSQTVQGLGGKERKN